MNYQGLYQEFKWKRMHERQAEEIQHNRIRNLANQTHTIPVSHELAVKKTAEILSQYPDEEEITVEDSIPILKDLGVFLFLDSVFEVKQKLEESEEGNIRLKDEATFLLHLWNMIDEEKIKCIDLKEILMMLKALRKSELLEVLCDKNYQEQKIKLLLASWNTLCMNQQYYKYATRDSRLKNSSKASSHAEMSGNRMPLSDTSNIMHHHGDFGYTCQLSINEEKDLIDRLYRTDIYEEREAMKKEQDEKKIKEELSQCTFKPNVSNRARSLAIQKKNREVKGYEKAVSRMKTGQQKNKISKQLRQYKPIGENYQKLREQKVNPPKFLNREKKTEEKVLFIISFDLGRYKTNVKIRESDTEDSVAEKLCRIYSLKQQFYEQIRQIVKGQLQAYYKELYEQEALHLDYAE